MGLYEQGKESEKQYARELTQKVEHENKVYREKFDSLQRVNARLSEKVLKTDSLLTGLRYKNASLRFQLQSTIVSYNNDTSLVKNQEAFDSLANLSNEYVFHTQAQDSLCRFHMLILKEKIKNHDSL
ncbi:MAG TPA: hypothetical protein DEP18_09085, partial [Flavobacteriales bacterium]|nr:hypothetical protein [Flavobacteriales bacterium]